MRLASRLTLILSAALAPVAAMAGPAPHTHGQNGEIISRSAQPICHRASECSRASTMRSIATTQPNVVRPAPRPVHRHAIVTPGYAVKLPAQVHMVNAPHHRAAGSSLERGVRVFRPAPNANLAYAASISLNEQRAKAQEAANAARLRAESTRRAAQDEAIQASLDAIAANQKAILAQGRRNTNRYSGSSRRRTFYGNPPFFGRNGFIGNSNFSGATIQIERRRNRKAKRD